MALVSKIQRYSTKDGPGLRSTVFFVGCNLRCRWCSNPELIEPGEKILYHPNRCVACGACVTLSQNQSILLTQTGCVIDRARCTNLADCANACYYDAYEILGTEMTAEELAEKLLRDKEFYQTSGGGVTFSGGEAALWGEFLLETAALLRKEGVHTALDTAGHIPFASLLPVAKGVGLLLYDVKAMDETLHERYTGVGNGLILGNARKLAERGIPMILRLVLIPGINDGTDFTNRLLFARELGKAVQQVDILPYHTLGGGKYQSLSWNNPMEGVPECPQDIAQAALRLALHMGLPAMLGG